MADLIERLLAGPIDADLSDRELSLLDAHLSKRPSLSDYATPAFVEARDKLKAIQLHNRKLRKRKRATPAPTLGGEPLFELPKTQTAFEDERQRTCLFDPAHAKLIGVVSFPNSVVVHCLFLQESGNWLLLEMNLYGKILKAIVPDGSFIPKGKFLAQNQAVDWLLKNGQPVPDWIDVSDRYGPVVDSHLRQTAAANKPIVTGMPEPAIPQSQQEMLIAMLELGAVDSDSRRTTSEIEKQAGATDGKRAIAELRKLAFLETKQGRGGGAWLTPLGQSRAERLKR